MAGNIRVEDAIFGYVMKGEQDTDGSIKSASFHFIVEVG